MLVVVLLCMWCTDLCQVCLVDVVVVFVVRPALGRRTVSCRQVVGHRMVLCRRVVVVWAPVLVVMVVPVLMVVLVSVVVVVLVLVVMVVLVLMIVPCWMNSVVVMTR